MTTVDRPITTADELLRADDTAGRSELIRGNLIMMTPAGANHGQIAIAIGSQIYQFVAAHDLGRTFAAETGFKLESNPDTVRAADAAFVSRARLPAGPITGFFPGAPDLAVEVLSPDDTMSYIQDKVQQYLDHGTRQVWVADPANRTLTVYTPDHQARVYQSSETVPGDEMLPGFELPLTQVFAQH